MGYQSEAALENELIKDLSKMGYERVLIKGEEELKSNLKKQLEKFNHTKLKQHGKESFSDKEFEKILIHLDGGTIFEKSKKLRDKYELPLDNGDIFYVDFINIKDWCHNEFQVSNQISDKGKFTVRYDVTILINGLPLVQIELKKRGKEMIEAFHQVARYRSYAFTGLFGYIQIFVLSNGVTTKYFSNNKTLSEKQIFSWADEENEKQNNLSKFTESFLEKCHLAKMLTRYIVLSEEENTLMVLRPYQYNAVEKIIKLVEDTPNKNGYVWHTTGSGKTLTSFKASQILSKWENVDKVVFCVDRKDLNAQTLKEFNSFSKDSVDSTENTKKLIKQLTDNKSGTIVTTLQKLNNAVSKPYNLELLEPMKNKRIVFIFDECHRSQFGESHTKINNFFTNKQFIGFTGTPIFKTNHNNNKTTEMLFGDCLHRYIIKDAIADNNVLKFSVEYISTMKHAKMQDSSGRDYAYDSEKIKNIDKKEVFGDLRRLELITDHIISIHNKKTKNGTYTAIFAVNSIENLIKYYDLFKKKKEEGKHNLKIATVFTYKANQDFSDEGNYDPEFIEENPHNRVKLQEYADDYHKMYNSKFDISKNFNGYQIDISKKVKAGQVDILLVVNMFLTGFDSKKLNTIYIDKNLKYHGLIQAYSRTNRLYDTKKVCGYVVNYRNLIKNTEDAIVLFSDEDALSIVLSRSYEEYVEESNEAIDNLKKVFDIDGHLDGIQSENEKLEIIRRMRALIRMMNKLEAFSEFDYKDIEITEHQYSTLRSNYVDQYNKTKNNDKESILDDIDFEINLLRRDKINVDYILNLLKELSKEDKDYDKKKNTIIKIMAINQNLRNKKELVEEFIEECNAGGLDEFKTEGEFDKFMNRKKEIDLEDLCKKEEVDINIIKEVVDEYQYVGKMNSKKIKSSIKKPTKIEGSFLSAKIAKKKKVSLEIKELVDKYTW